MSKLSCKMNNLNDPYYTEFIGINGPLSMLLNDYIIKNKADKEYFLFDFLERYTKLVNEDQSIHQKLQNLFQYYASKIRPESVDYEYVDIPKDQIQYVIGRYIIGEQIAVPYEVKCNKPLGEIIL